MRICLCTVLKNSKAKSSGTGAGKTTKSLEIVFHHLFFKSFTGFISFSCVQSDITLFK
jgi:hypothetical protein